VTGQQRITGALFVDLGEGREIKHGARAGQITYKRQPAARFECLLCRTSQTATGADDVRSFVATIRTTHPVHCNPQHTTTERQAA
jgi:hypothetical protein